MSVYFSAPLGFFEGPYHLSHQMLRTTHLYGLKTKDQAQLLGHITSR